jgi:hypothetical protein
MEKPKSLSSLTLFAENPSLKEGEVIKIGTEDAYDYFKIIKIDGITLTIQQLSEDSVLFINERRE